MLITEKFIKVKINNSIWLLTLHKKNYIIINVTKRNLVYKIRLINFLTILFEYYVIPILFLNIFQYINNNFVYDSTRNDPSNDCSPGEEDIFQGIRFIRTPFHPIHRFVESYIHTHCVPFPRPRPSLVLSLSTCSHCLFPFGGRR